MQTRQSRFTRLDILRVSHARNTTVPNSRYQRNLGGNLVDFERGKRARAIGSNKIAWVITGAVEILSNMTPVSNNKSTAFAQVLITLGSPS